MIKSGLRNSTVLSVAFCDILGWSVAKKDKKKMNLYIDQYNDIVIPFSNKTKNIFLTDK